MFHIAINVLKNKQLISTVCDSFLLSLEPLLPFLTRLLHVVTLCR